MTRADLDKKPAEVAAMFDALAGRYDLMNDVLSMGQVRLWRRRVQRILQAGPGDRVLDLAAGTGTSSVTFAEAGADVVACDFSLGMLQAGQARQVKHDPFQAKTRGRVAFAAGDALRLPFRDGAFDAATISFGLRNVHGTREALEEMRRVTRPGGRLVVCEFSTIAIAPKTAALSCAKYSTPSKSVARTAPNAVGRAAKRSSGGRSARKSARPRTFATEPVENGKPSATGATATADQRLRPRWSARRPAASGVPATAAARQMVHAVWTEKTYENGRARK